MLLDLPLVGELEQGGRGAHDDQEEADADHHVLDGDVDGRLLVWGDTRPLHHFGIDAGVDHEAEGIGAVPQRRA